MESGAANECLCRGMDGGAVLAGICAGSLVLARAGALKGRRITHSYTEEFTTTDVVACTSPFYEGSLFVRADLVVDRPVITAQYWAASRFAVAIAETIGVISSDESDACLRRYGRRLDASRA
jgi:4-methyl-5(b-hydroxyethyl)-thiazole monophosphate biosynthesis